MIGKTINGYAIKEFLGKGSFGEVYKAVKENIYYAIKFIRTDFIFDIERERLHREIVALQRVDSKSTVKYFEDGDYTENFTNYKYIVMELVEGETLREYLHKKGTALEEAESVALITNILNGINHIHSNNIIHRDLKPENIKIINGSDIKILDYGLSKVIDYSSITQTGAQLGSYYYMSPEQVKGEKPISPVSDFYAIGSMLFELLTGTILFYPSTEAEIVYKTVYVKPPFPSTINPKVTNHLENLILKLLQKEPYERFRTVDEILEELHKPTPAPKVEKAEKLKFYPRLIQNDTTIIDTFLKDNKIDGADFPINLHAQYKSIASLLKKRSSAIDFFADPSTNRLVFTNFRKTKGLVALPYAPTGFDPLEPDYFSTVEIIKDFARTVIDLQIANGCSILTAPFFYFDNTNDDWYVINIKLLRESIDYVREKYPQYKVSGAICTQAETLCRKKERQSIIEDFGYSQMDFCQFYIDEITENTVDAQLYNFILTGKSIKEFNKCKLVACRVPGVAQGLLSVGFDAITSGLAVIESFNKGVIVKDEDSVTMPTRFYFPDLLLSVTMNSGSGLVADILAQEEDLKQKLPDIAFSLSCTCKGCEDGKMSTNFQQPRLHFLHARQKEIAELNAIDVNQRKIYFIERINKAYLLQQKLVGQGIKLKSPSYLLTWKEILEKY